MVASDLLNCALIFRLPILSVGQDCNPVYRHSSNMITDIRLGNITIVVLVEDLDFSTVAASIQSSVTSYRRRHDEALFCAGDNNFLVFRDVVQLQLSVIGDRRGHITAIDLYRGQVVTRIDRNDCLCVFTVSDLFRCADGAPV